MDRIFWATCPQCANRYSVDYSLRHDTEVRLECPQCRHKFPVAEASRIEE